MRAGFAKIEITPPLGTPLMGAGAAWGRCAEGVLDPLYARVLYVEQGQQRAVICGLDVCFVDREDVRKFSRALVERSGLDPRSVLINASHTHAGPALGTYFDLQLRPPPADYVARLWKTVSKALKQARGNAAEVRIRAGVTQTALPLNRRCRRNGRIENAPNPSGPVLKHMPLCLFEDPSGNPKCLLFSASTHPVAVRGKLASPDWPGAAMRRVDAHLGAPSDGCSLFLQGCAGDSRPRNLVQNEGRDWNMKTSGQPEAEEAGRIIAADVIAGLGSSLRPVTPELRSASVETQWRFEPVPRRVYEQTAANSDLHPVQHEWARRCLRLLDQQRYPQSLPVLLQSIQLGDTLRLIALEGEPVAEHGHALLRAFPDGTTFPLGYSNGEAMYLPTSPMLDEGGYEVDSYWEFGQPAPFAKGMEQTLELGVANLRRQGIH